MLIRTRKPGESLYLFLSDDVDPKTPIGEVFGDGPIVVRVGELKANAVRVGVEAPCDVLILRDGLVDTDPDV